MSLVLSRSWQISILIHLGCVLVFFALTQIKIPETEMIDVPIVVEQPKEVQKLTKVEEKPKVVLKSINKTEQDLAAKETRSVFGVNRDAHTDSSDKEGIEAKKGNTVAKAQDNETLLDSDSSSLPTPTEEYLVSEMPSLLSEVRPTYPKEARDNKVEGKVILDILIDQLGKVRDAKVIEGESIFYASALDAIKKFLFRPATAEGKSVAVRIRYTLNFKLEF